MKWDDKTKLCKGCESLYTQVPLSDGSGTTDLVNCRMPPIFGGRE